MANRQHAQSMSIFLYGIFLGSFLWTTQIPAQAGTTDSSLSAAERESEVQIFTVAPMLRSTAILMPNAQTPAPPEPLDSPQKSGILKNLGGIAAKSEVTDPKGHSTAKLEHIILSARQPFFKEQGFLTLALPYAVHPETSIKFKNDFPGSAAVKLKVDKGQTYLLDFAVKSWGSGTYLLETESGKQDFEDESVSKQHVLVALKATSSGWTTVRLKREGAGYHLYYVEVTRVD